MPLSSRWNSLKVDSKLQAIDPESTIWYCPIFIRVLWSEDLIVLYYYWFILSFLKLKFWGGCLMGFNFEGKTWVSFSSGFGFSPTLNRRWKSLVVYISTPLMPIVMNSWAMLHYLRACTPNRAGYPRLSNMNAVRIRGSWTFFTRNRNLSLSPQISYKKNLFKNCVLLSALTSLF